MEDYLHYHQKESLYKPLQLRDLVLSHKMQNLLLKSLEELEFLMIQILTQLSYSQKEVVLGKDLFLKDRNYIVKKV
jgi:hypothetical protein